MQTSVIDWFRILADLRNKGLSQAAVADKIQVPRTRVRDWAAGMTPRFDDGALLVILWLKTTQTPSGTYTIQNNSTDHMMQAALSVRCLALPKKGR